MPIVTVRLPQLLGQIAPEATQGTEAREDLEPLRGLRRAGHIASRPDGRALRAAVSETWTALAGALAGVQQVYIAGHQGLSQLPWSRASADQRLDG